MKVKLPRSSRNYISIKVKNHPHANKKGYIYEHRLVMEKKLKRYLRHNEFVHHINGISSCNNINNLKLVSPSEHTAIHNIDRGIRIKNIKKKLIQEKQDYSTIIWRE